MREDAVRAAVKRSEPGSGATFNETKIILNQDQVQLVMHKKIS